jgi:AraC-like DNA-binding protein
MDTTWPRANIEMQEPGCKALALSSRFVERPSWPAYVEVVAMVSAAHDSGESAYIDNGEFAPHAVAGTLAWVCAQPCCDAPLFAAASASLHLLMRNVGRYDHSTITDRLFVVASERQRLFRVADRRVGDLLDALAAGNADALARSERQWSRGMHLHPSQLGRLLRAHTGLGFCGIRRLFRIKRAAPLIGLTGDRISAVAFAAGYEHSQLSQFSREFTAHLGIPPRAYRTLVQWAIRSRIIKESQEQSMKQACALGSRQLVFHPLPPVLRSLVLKGEPVSLLVLLPWVVVAAIAWLAFSGIQISTSGA